MRISQGFNRLTNTIIYHSSYVSLFSLRDILLLSRDVSASFSGVNFRFIASMPALINFCPFDESHEVEVDFGLVFSPLNFFFGLVRGAKTGSANGIVLSIIDSH